MPRCPNPLDPAPRLLAIDSGWCAPGACVLENGLIRRAIKVRIPDAYTKLGPMERSRAVAVAISTQLGWSTAPHLVAEWPQIDQRSRRLNPESLFGMAGVCGALSGLLHPTRQLSPQPRDWAGSIPKVTDGDPWRSPRASMLLAVLETGEREAIEDSHDAIDAACIALWAISRWPPKRRFARP